jgi:hypothetical protein
MAMSDLTPPSLPAAASPLTPEHLLELERAKLRYKKIKRVIGVATCDAWLAAFFAGITLLSAILSPISLLLGAVLAFVAFNSFRGVRLLRQLDARAPRLLAMNQILLAGIIIVYSIICIWAARGGEGVFSSELTSDPAVAAQLGDYKHLAWIITLSVYASLIVGTIIAQGLTALYYSSRAKYLRAYVDETPRWVLDLQGT